MLRLIAHPPHHLKATRPSLTLQTVFTGPTHRLRCLGSLQTPCKALLVAFQRKESSAYLEIASVVFFLMGWFFGANTVDNLEYVPAGEGCPPWLFDALLDASNHAPLLLLHPTELHRQQTIERLHEAGAVVSPQHHLTLNRLVRLLHVDLRLPVLLDDEASTFMALHARCKSAADNAELPFLYTPGVGEWTLTKTRRLQRLHGELLQLRRPFAWEGDPGASVFHQICLEVEREAGGTLPALVTRHVVEALQTASTPRFISVKCRELSC